MITLLQTLGRVVTVTAGVMPLATSASWMVGIELGRTETGGELVRLGISGPRAYALGQTGTWSWDVTPEMVVGRWSDSEYDRSVWEVGVTPLFAAHRAVSAGQIGINFGIGAHLLSAVRFEDRRLGSAFQFGDHIGVEWRSPSGRWTLGYRYQHLSNASIQPPNDGVEFHLLRLDRSF